MPVMLPNAADRANVIAYLETLGRAAAAVAAAPAAGAPLAQGPTQEELLRAALGSVLEVHATSANLNNLVGVPLTLLSIPDAADVAVVEMGTNQPGEVPRLRAIVEEGRPQVGRIHVGHLDAGRHPARGGARLVAHGHQDLGHARRDVRVSHDKLADGFLRKGDPDAARRRLELLANIPILDSGQDVDTLAADRGAGENRAGQPHRENRED